MSKAIKIIIAILIIVPSLAIMASAIANALLNQRITKEVEELFNNNGDHKKEIIDRADLAGLPACVQKWLENSQVIGKEKIRTVRLKQKGLMRLEKGSAWMPAEAEQYFTIDKPGFVWRAKIKMAPLVYFAGRDKYANGKGHMLIKALSLFPVADAAGKEMDQGTLLRYLAEMQWFPTAALNNYIKWEEIDANSAKATMSYGQVTASGIFRFNGQGELINFTAQRYRDVKGQYVLTNWGGVTKGYREFNGFRIANKGEVFWELETGVFDWYHWEITDIEYNKPFTY